MKSIISSSKILFNNVKRNANLNNNRFLSTSQQDWGVFPREREGNIYDVNWSLTEDGVVPTGDAFRNPRLQLLTSRLSSKVQNGKIELTKPVYDGKYNLVEAGDSMNHNAFTNSQTKLHEYLSSGQDLFIEDGSLGSYSPSRIGVRVVTDNAATSLIARSLLIPTPPRDVDHRARFNGWNFDERWNESTAIWNGNSYNLATNNKLESAKGQRPIVAYVGGPGDVVAVQFVEVKKQIVGANIIVGENAPIRGLIDSLGHATCVLVNEQQTDSIALACTSVVNKDGKTTIIIGGEDNIAEAALSKGMLYGAYHNVLSKNGVSALWNGLISKSSTSTDINTPVVVVGGKSAIANSPNNISNPVNTIIFYDYGSTNSKLSEEKAIERIVAMSDDSKKELVIELVKGKKLLIVGKEADCF